MPDYSAEAARTLSEEQFLTLFRDEAGALLALPRHRNLATFVTFDAGARPKPILVMELVEGPTLERVIERGELTIERALALLDGLCDGLSGMHRVGIGHLDVKPSNVILRTPPGIGHGDAARAGRLRACRPPHPTRLRDGAVRRAGDLGSDPGRRAAAADGRRRVRVRLPGVRGADRRHALRGPERAGRDQRAPLARRLSRKAACSCVRTRGLRRSAT